jgi:hypothetical protein
LDKTDGTGKLDKVSGAQYVGKLKEERPKVVEDVVETVVCFERQFCCVEGNNRAICSSTPCGRGNSNSIVEEETKSSVSLDEY